MGFMCAECGGNVADNQRVGPDAKWTLRGGATIPFPQTVRLPVCEKCGECYLSKLAIDAVETALSEMHDALVEHFAPVLRWEDIHPSLSTARLGEWMIDVTNGGWYLFLLCEDGRRLVRHAVTIDEGLTHVERKRAAEAALRALGVPFRVEGE